MKFAYSSVRDGPLENLWGGGGGEVPKKNSRKGKLNEKKFLLWPKKKSYKEFDNEKKFLRLENSPPPNNLSNGQSLMCPFKLNQNF